MNEVNVLNVARLGSGDFYQFIENVVSIVSSTENETLAGVVQTLKDDQADLLNSYQKEKLTLETQEIVALDKKRDRAFLKFKTMVEAYSYDDDNQENIQASVKLKTIIDLFGNGKLIAFDYNKETASITGMISDLRTKATPELNLLSLTDTVDYVESCNNQFKSLYALRGDAASILANVVPFYKLRKEVAAHYKNFVCDLESLQRLAPADAGQASDVITRINVEIEKFRLLIPAAPSSNGQPAEA